MVSPWLSCCHEQQSTTVPRIAYCHESLVIEKEDSHDSVLLTDGTCNNLVRDEIGII